MAKEPIYIPADDLIASLERITRVMKAAQKRMKAHGIKV
jgi:hypothetical protein